MNFDFNTKANLKQMKVSYFFVLILSVSLSACHSIPESGIFETKKIVTGYGPEDIILDSISDANNPRILVSCDTRRKSDSLTTGIYWIDLKTDSVFEFERLKEPEDLVFHPHGFDLVLIDSVPRLFVISHDDENKRQQVLQYKMSKNVLTLEKLFQNDLFSSPNDIFALKDGSFFLTNDAGKRHSFAEQLFKLKRSSVVYYTLDLKPYIIADNLSYANGIFFEEPYLYISTVLQNTIFKFTIEDGKVIQKQSLSEIVGGDNITKFKNKFIVAAHLNSIAFLRHRGNANIASPSVIYEFDPITGEKRVLFSDDGKLISAASTAIRYGNFLYIAQVFDNFVLKVKLPEH